MIKEGLKRLINLCSAHLRRLLLPLCGEFVVGYNAAAMATILLEVSTRFGPVQEAPRNRKAPGVAERVHAARSVALVVLSPCAGQYSNAHSAFRHIELTP